MITIKTEYLGDLRTEATHVQSYNTLITDAPIDNNGKGETFSPTDLLVTSLGSCMLTLMGITANAHNIDISDASLEITKVMGTEPRRVIEAIIKITISGHNYTDKEKKMLERAAINCPVAKSLHPDLKQTVSFKY